MATLLPWQLSAEEAAMIPKSDLGMVERSIGWKPGGLFKTRTANFSGVESVDSTGFNLYGVDGINPAWVYDGNVVRFIETGMSRNGFVDNPNSLAVLPAEILALGYDSGALLLSSLGQPTDFDVASGAAEIAVGDEIVELVPQPNDLLAIFCRSAIRMLHGKTVLDMQLYTYSEKIGVTPESVQEMGDSVFEMDDGISRLNRVQEFGDFRDLSLTAKVKPLMEKLKRDLRCSWNVVSRNEYRAMYNNRLGVAIKFNATEVAGITTFDYGRLFNVVHSGEDLDGREHVYAGDTEDGLVYRLEHGTSFDGRPIEALGTTVFNFLEGVEQRKRFKKVQVEVDTRESVDMQIRVELDYSSPEAPAAFPHHLLSSGGDGYYDMSYFSNLLWSDEEQGMTDHYLQGVGRNVAISVYSKSDKEMPHVLSTAVFHWSPRGKRR